MLRWLARPEDIIQPWTCFLISGATNGLVTLQTASVASVFPELCPPKTALHPFHFWVSQPVFVCCLCLGCSNKVWPTETGIKTLGQILRPVFNFESFPSRQNHWCQCEWAWLKSESACEGGSSQLKVLLLVKWHAHPLPAAQLSSLLAPPGPAFGFGDTWAS